MSPSRISTYPDYDVRKIVSAMRSPTPDLVLLAAHRGSRFNGLTENSLASVAAASSAGIEIVEVDVRITADGHPVILHDQGIGRIVSLPAGKEGFEPYNPFTGEGSSPLVKDTRWEGDLEHAMLLDENGRQTEDHPISLKELLTFIREERINIVVQLDIKDFDAIAASYDVLIGHENAAGVPALDWCIFKLGVDWFPTPDALEREPWVRAGRPFKYIPVFEPSYVEDIDVIAVMRQWQTRDYFVAFEIGMRGRGGTLQEAMDYIGSPECECNGVGLFRPAGDLAKEYYEGSALMIWDDRSVREDIIKGGVTRPWTFNEFKPATPYDSVLRLGESASGHDERGSIRWIIEQRFTWVITDFADDMHATLSKLGKRNVWRLVKGNK